MIKCKTILTALLCLLTSTIVFAQAKPRAAVSKAAFERLKALAGQWSGKSERSLEETSSFVVMSGGTVVIETTTAGTESMPTVYYLNGKDLVLIHYCAGGNQPRMRLDPKSSTDKELRFLFAGGTNLNPRHDSHMHAHTIVFLDRQRIRSEWKDYTNGREDATDVVSLSRVK